MEKLAIVTDKTPQGVPTTTLVKITRDGAIENALTKVQLKPEEYYSQKIQDGDKKYQTKKAINANGYNRINRWLGVTFLCPDTILSDTGVKLPNPYVEREKGEVIRVRVRRVGVGRSVTGDLQIIDLICVYDVNLYFCSDVYNRFKFSEGKWGKLSAREPKESEAFVLKLPVGDMHLAMDLNDPTVQGLVREYIDRQKFAERNAITICQRNILNQFLGTRYADHDGCVTFTHWPKSSLTPEDLEFVRMQLNEGRQVVTLGGQVVQRDTATIEVAGDEDDIDNEE